MGVQPPLTQSQDGNSVAVDETLHLIVHDYYLFNLRG